jgi:hypothetical protein
MTSLKPLTAPLAPFPEVPEGYEVVSQQPLPERFNLFRGHPKLFLYPVACAIAFPCAFIGSEGPGRMDAMLISLSVALILSIMMTARSISDRIIARQQIVLLNEPSVQAAADDSGVDAATIAKRLSAFSGHQRCNWMSYLGRDTRIIINLREPGDKGVFTRKLPAGKRSFGILRKIGC